MSKDWIEDFEHENGNYQNICKICNSKFMGHKIRRVCKECYTQQQVSVEPVVKPVDYGTCKNCIFNLETDENSLISECQLTIDEFTGIGLQFSRDFGCNQWQSKPSV